MKVTWTARARTRLAEIHDYIAEKLSFVAGRIERQALTIAGEAPRGKNVAKNATFSLRSV
jgi:hypothetical protein